MVDVLADHIHYAGELPLRWRPLEELPDWAALARLNQADEELLAVISGQEQMRDNLKEDDDPLNARLDNLESKLNLVIDLVGQLLRQNLLIPAPLPLRFNAEGVIWGGGESLPNVDALIVVEIFPSTLIPRPLSLPGRVAAVGEEKRVVHVSFEGVGEPLADLIHKYVFRYHRRAVALARANRDG